MSQRTNCAVTAQARERALFKCLLRKEARCEGHKSVKRAFGRWLVVADLRLSLSSSHSSVHYLRQLQRQRSELCGNRKCSTQTEVVANQKKLLRLQKSSEQTLRDLEVQLQKLKQEVVLKKRALV